MTMSRIPTRSAPDSASFHDYLGHGRAWLAVLVPILLLGSVAAVRGSGLAGWPSTSAFAGAAADLTPEQLTAAAADKLEDTTKAGGSGYRFEIVQTSTMVAKPGGPRIPIPDPVTRGTLRMADTYYLNALLERGVARPDGFWSQMRAGPSEGAKPDWTGAPILYEALVRGGERWRTDGHGWYKAQALPGIGLDPDTAALLPDLLRGATSPVDVPAGDPKVDPDAVRTLEDSATAAQIPGVVAAGGAAFTALTEPVAYGFDDTGRLVSVRVVARNTNMTDFDLVVETTIDIAYDGVDGLPDPEPALHLTVTGS
jgi:hypothetical protein